MIKFNFEEQTVEFPESWDEVPVKMFILPEFLSGDAMGMLSALSGVDKGRLCNTTENLDPYLTKAVKFLKTDPMGWKGKKVKTVRILDVTCKVPKNIELEMYGQKVMYSQALARNDNYYQSMPECVAIYLAPIIFPKEEDKWFDRIEQVTDAIKDMPITEIHPLADFFLDNTKLLRSDGTLK